MGRGQADSHTLSNTSGLHIQSVKRHALRTKTPHVYTRQVRLCERGLHITRKNPMGSVWYDIT